MTRKYQPLTDLERFDLVQVMFPDLLTDEHDIGDEEEILFDKFGIEVDEFDALVGHLVMCAPVLVAPISGERHHVLGKVTVTDTQQCTVAAVKREVQTDD